VYVFSYGINYETGDGDVEFYQVKDNELQQIYSSKRGIMNWAGITVVDKNTYFTIDNKVYQYKNGNFKEFLSVDNDNFYWHICGRNTNDIFIAMKDGIAHYNGTDMEYIYRFPIEGMGIIGHPLILDEDIFYGIVYPGTQWYNMILHGKMVE
jgi:hypothetical protein